MHHGHMYGGPSVAAFRLAPAQSGCADLVVVIMGRRGISHAALVAA
jgi:hypothetical protein